MRDFIANICGRVFSLGLCTALLALTSCIPTVPLAPLAGVAEYQRGSLIALGHARANTAGGNLLFTLPPMVVDTQVGAQSFGATYNAADGRWIWSYYDLFYDGQEFLDPTGHRNSLSYLNPYGRLMPANRYWMPLDGQRMQTAGGVVHEFDPTTHRLAAIYRGGLDYPRIVVAEQEILQCSDASTCDSLFEVGRDAEGRIIWVKDRPGPEQRTASYVYDASGRLSVAKSAGDVQAGRPGFRFGYSLFGSALLVSTTNSEDEQVEYSYDLSGRVTGATLIGGSNPTTQLSYGTADGLAFTRVFDALGNERVYRHDGYRQLREITDAEGWTTEYEWDGLRVTRRTTPAGVVTRWVHAGDTTTQILPSGNAVETTFLASAVNLEDPWSRAVLAVNDLDELGAARTLRQNVYSPEGLLGSTTDGNGDTLFFGYYNGMPLVAYVPNPSGGNPVAFLTEYHGPHGHPTEVGYSVGTVPITETQTFSSAGDPTSGPSMDHAEAEGRPNIRQLHYDHDRNLSAIDYGTCFIDPQTQECSTTQSNPDEGTTTITRRSDGRPLLISRPLGNDSQLVYDLHGRLVERRDRADGTWQSTHFGRDLAGRLSFIAAPNAMRVDYEYDADGRETRATWTKPGTTTMIRDTLYTDGRVASVLDSTRGGLQTFEYDAAGRVSAVNYPAGERMELSYDLRNLETRRRLIFADSSENSIETEYDGASNWSLHKLDGVVFAEQEVVAGTRRTLAFGSGNARVEREWLYSSGQGGRPIATITRDHTGAQLELTDILKDSGYGWDKTSISASIELAGGTASLSETFWEEDNQQVSHLGPRAYGEGEYEDAQTGSLFPEQLFSYDPLGNQLDPGIAYNSDHTRLLSAFAKSYTSDASGYVSQIDDPGAGTSTVIVRNAQGRAIEIQHTGQAAIELDRDTLGRPLANLFGGLVAVGPTGERSLDQTDVRLDLDPGGCHLGRYVDFRGNVRFTVDLCSGLPQKALEYGAYGLAATYGSDGDDRGFAGGRELAADLVLLGARLYQPSTGRFLSPDPIYQRGDQFAYAEGNPVQLWDPSGEHPGIALLIVLAIITGFATGAGTAITQDWLEGDGEEEGNGDCGCGASGPSAAPAGGGGAVPAPAY